MAHQTQDTLNFAFIGSGGVGKTTLVETLLHKAGAINAQGSVDAGDTVSDFLPAEKEAKHSVDPSFMSFAYEDRHLTVVDTPGFHDYLGRSLSVLPAVETAVLVVDASAGLDTYAQRLFARAGDRGLCRMIVVNKIDAENADVAGLVDQLQISIGSECLPINLPTDSGTNVVDCFFELSDTTTDFDSIESAHEKILDQVVEVDEDLMEMYLEQGDDLPKDQLHSAFETALRNGHLIPVCFVSAETGCGVAEFLDIGCKLLPNPTEANPVPFRKSTANGDEELSVDSDSSASLLAHVVKVSIDPFRGRMAVVRVHQGTMKSGAQVYVGSDRKPTKIAHIFRLVGGEQVEIEEAVAGDICALPRMETVNFNGILHEARDEQNVFMDPIPIPTPVLGKAVHVPNDNEAQKVAEVLNNIAFEDPSFQVVHVAALNETVIRGMGELHLREIVERIEKQQGIRVETDFPSIEYKETITVPAEGHNRHKKQTGGAGQFGEVYLRIEPLDRGSGFEFVDKIVGGVIPGQFIPAVEKGVKQVMDTGAISGHELQDVRVTVYDGKHHPVDSKEIAFVQAGRKAFLDAVAKARPIVMEPVVNVSINVPNDCMGDVTGDLASMGGMVNGSSVLADSTTDISGQVPLREMQTYHSRLSSISGGKGNYSMEFSHYAAVLPMLQKELASNFTVEEED